MAIIRVEKTKDYTTMSNYHFREKDMSLKAKGLLSLILSLPEDWDYTLEGLATLCRDGKDSVRTALNELEEFGYMETARVRDEKGRLRGTEYVVREKPTSNLPEKENPDPEEADPDNGMPEEPAAGKPTLENPVLEKPMLENPTLENPALEKPTLENPTQLNTNISNTDLSNTDLSNHCAENTNPRKRPECSRAYYPEDARLDEAFKAFVYMRKRINKPLTDKAIQLTRESLADMAKGESGKMDIEKAVAILNQSTMNSWSGLYALKQPPQDNNRGQPAQNMTDKDWENLEKQVLAN